MAEGQDLKIRLPEPAYQALKVLAKQTGLSMSKVLVSLLMERVSGVTVTRLSPQSHPTCGSPHSDPTLTPESPHNDPTFDDKKGGIGGNGGFSNQPEEKTTPTTEGVQGKQKKPRAVKVAAEHPGFDAFWNAYPKRCPRRDRSVALKSWNKHTPPLEAVLEALAWQDKQSDWAWTDEKGEYGRIPMPATWINQHRWEREQPSGALPAAPVPTENLLPPGHPDWLKIDRAMGKTSADYNQYSHRTEWSRHKLWEMQGRDPSASRAQ